MSGGWSFPSEYTSRWVRRGTSSLRFLSLRSQPAAEENLRPRCVHRPTLTTRDYQKAYVLISSLTHSIVRWVLDAISLTLHHASRSRRASEVLSSLVGHVNQGYPLFRPQSGTHVSSSPEVAGQVVGKNTNSTVFDGVILGSRGHDRGGPHMRTAALSCRPARRSCSCSRSRSE